MKTEVPLRFGEIVKEEIPVLTEVMIRSFDDDAQKHPGEERGGPPGYDNGEFFREWLFGYDESIGYKVVAIDQVIGAIIVWVFELGKNILGTIFVDPEYQDRGVGTQIWQFIEASYPETMSWQLETPEWATKNHHFYEKKCGFTKVGEKDEFFIYKKEMLG
jgi:GNAT superfamily N-acetyltransferase